MSGTGFIPPIAFERLDAMFVDLDARIAAARARGDLDDVARLEEIKDALDWMYVAFAIQSTRGRKHSTAMHWRAYRVHCLVERGAYLGSAVDAVLGDDATFRKGQALARAYQSLKAATGFREFVSVDPAVIERDAARLPKTRRRAR